jgi:energy-coupling factor transporter transmembrane protein EcfT
MLLLLASMAFSGESLGLGFYLWLKILLKSNAVIIMIFGLFYGMDFAELGYGLAFFRVPEKFIQLFLFTARFNQLMKIECASLLESLKERS